MPKADERNNRPPMTFEQYARSLGESCSSRGVCLVVSQQLPSTHLLARRVVQDYTDESAQAPAADFLAWQQTEGRGRHDRPWASPAGAGVYATLVRSRASDELQTLPLLVGTTLCEVVNTHLDGRGRLKWPNDLLVDGRKLGGILIDVVSRGEGESMAIVSFGINHSGEPAVPGATSIEREAREQVALPNLAVELIAAVDAALGEPAPVEEIVDRYEKLSIHRSGETIRCRAEAGELEGVFRGFDRHGFLRLAVAGEEQLLTAGEVVHGEVMHREVMQGE
ncbi:MAG: biotin--[acetyl-CoA-carboxylase] ligase [bacterium]|nr:biotin--[acetyl-CoA-carboxylase] ligase [bacterium]